MKSASKPPWYACGLAFECIGCGRCCAGPEEGYVWVSDAEIAAIAEQLAISADEARSRYTRKVGGRMSLIERPDNCDCIFLTGPGDNGDRGCDIYPVRPAQCRTWPFWPTNMRNPDTWSSAARRCPGINRGKVFVFDEITERIVQTPQ